MLCASSVHRLSRLYDKLASDNVFFMAAGLAFSVFTTLIPLLVLLFAVVGYALASSEAATREVISAVRRLLPFASEEIIGSLLVIMHSHRTIGLIGLVGLIWAATTIVSSIRTVLNTVFEVRETRSLIVGKLFDLVMVLVLGVFFLLSIGFTAAFALVQELGTTVLREAGVRTDWVAPATALGAALLINVVMFTLLYTTAPARPVPLRVAAIGGTTTALLFELAKQLFRVYISLAREGTLGPASGTLGAIVLLLLWIYYSALVFILGAEVVFVFEARGGPARGAGRRTGVHGGAPRGVAGEAPAAETDQPPASTTSDRDAGRAGRDAAREGAAARQETVARQ